MIPQIKRILYATDLSRNSVYAFRYAVNSAENHDAQIHLLHVLERMPDSQENFLKAFLDAEKLGQIRATGRTEARTRIQKRLEAFCREELRNRPEGLKRVVAVEVVEGDPAGTILAKATELKADTVIMGTHGKGFLEHAFLGSVAEKVLQRIRIPVFIIPIPDEKEFAARKIEKPREMLDIMGPA
jgi:nucleotide-binding universal stress UspA family protein